MADETIIEPDTQNEPVAPQPSRSEERITELSGKVKTEAEARAKAEAERADAEKRALFAEGFADVLATQPQAKDFKDAIREKVMSGYSVEDAAFAVLGKAGKIGTPAATPAQPTASDVAGGSATVPISEEEQKGPSDMTQAERRAALLERAAELEDILQPKSTV